MIKIRYKVNDIRHIDFYQPVFHICFFKNEHRTSNVQHPTSNVVFQLKAFSIFGPSAKRKPFDVQCSMFDVGRLFGLTALLWFRPLEFCGSVIWSLGF